MQLRIKLYNARVRRERLAVLCGQSSLNLTCKKCKAPRQPALYEGDVCKSCYKPKPVEFVPYKPVKEIKDQTEATLALRPIVQGLMDEHGLKRATFARKMSLDPQTLYLWWTDRLGLVGQDRVNEKIRQGIDLHFSEAAA